MWRRAPTRSVALPGSELRKTLPAPAVTRPSHSLMVTVAGSRSATHTETRVGSTLRNIGPHSRSGRSMQSLETRAAEMLRGQGRQNGITRHRWAQETTNAGFAVPHERNLVLYTGRSGTKPDSGKCATE